MRTQLLAKHIKNNRGKISLSALLIVSVLVFTGVIFMVRHNPVNAASITSAKDVISTSAPAATSTHTITFTTPTGVAADATMTVTFPSTFTTGTISFSDIDLTDDSTDVNFADVAATTTWGATTTGIDSGFILTNGSAAVGAGSIIVIQIGDNATFGPAGAINMTNPAKVDATAGSADIYTVSIAGGFGDSGDMLIAIVEGVAVSVTIDESLTFTIAGQTATLCDNIFATESGPTATASSVPFGTVSTADQFEHACQTISIATNASSGYAVTVESDTSLKTGAGVLIDSGTCDGSCTDTTSDAWATEASNSGFAYSCDGGECDLSANTQYRTFACAGVTTTDCLPGGGEAAVTFMASTTAVDTVTTTIEYKLSFAGSQAAGTYSNTVTFIATPTF